MGGIQRGKDGGLRIMRICRGEANNSLRCFFDTYKWQKERKTIIFNYYLRMSKKSSTFAKFVENRNDST